MEENFLVELTQIVDEKLVSRIFNQDLGLKKIDSKFTFRLLDEMIKWDRRVLAGRDRMKAEDIDVLFPIQDYFFYMIMKADVKDIDEHLQRLFSDIYMRVHSKHRYPYYEGFFNCLFQFLMFRRWLMQLGKKTWIASWIVNLQESLNKLRISYT